MSGLPILSILVFLPLAGCLLLLPVWWRPALARPLVLAVALVELALTVGLYADWQGLAAQSTAIPGYLLTEDFPWIPAFGIRYTLALDGISLLMVLLTALDLLHSPVGIMAFHRGKDRAVPGADAGHGVGHHGRVPGAGPGPVLPVLGGHADTDVLPDRCLGAWPQDLLDGQVLPLHPGRVPADAAGDHRPAPDARPTERRRHLRPARTAGIRSSTPVPSSGCSGRSSWPLRSSSRCSRCIPGCPTPTPMPPPPAA